MPEAPEVQTVINYLQENLAGRKIVSASITHPKLSDNLPVSEMEQRLTNEHFQKFSRHGKYLIFEMDHFDWICHMRMEGKFLILDQLPEEEKIRKHIHAVFKLDNGKLLCYFDTRKFGRMQVYEKLEDKSMHPSLSKLGYDVLDPRLNEEYLFEKIHKRKIPIKSALLDQSVVAGIGNIYADEILFEARLDPRSVSSHLDLDDCRNIVQAAKRIISDAAAAKGTTIRTFSSGHGEAGTYQNSLKVHDRKDEPCFVCEKPVILIRVGQRSTYLCPECQILK